jgi:hypothetical protein
MEQRLPVTARFRNQPHHLSGDVGAEGDNTDNAYHVVTGSGVDATAILDGFNITHGNADGYALDYYNLGGGMYSVSAAPPHTINIISTTTSHTLAVGCTTSKKCNPSLDPCDFSNNMPPSVPEGLQPNKQQSPLNDVTYSGNSAVNAGGACSIFSK